MDPNDVTLQTYQANADRYRAQTGKANPAFDGFLRRFAMEVPGGHVLELGSGPGSDAKVMERFGLSVDRTDATSAFVEMMRADGHAAEVLDVRTDDLGGPYDGVIANAVLLHLSRADFASVVTRSAEVAPVLAFTVKEGDGEGWSEHKLEAPRHFTYWRAPQIGEVLAGTWSAVDIEHVQGAEFDWLFVMARL